MAAFASALSLGASTAIAEEHGEDPGVTPPLRVVVAGSAPFVMERAEEGLSPAVWAEVARRAARTSRMTMAPSIEEALEQVASGEADVAVGPITITAERSAKLAFTQPYFTSTLGIASRPEQSLFDRVRPFLSRAFMVGVGFLLVVLFAVGHLVWVLERRKNPEMFPASYASGVGAGTWLALVTMTTVGYGDKAPATPIGRVVMGVWMVLSMITASSLTASIATALTLSQIGAGAFEKLSDLPGETVAVVEGTRSERVVRRAGGRVLRVPNVDAGLEALSKGRAAAVVADTPVLEFALGQRADADADAVAVVSVGGGEHYGFAVRLGDTLLFDLDPAVLGYAESERRDTLEATWLGSAL